MPRVEWFDAFGKVVFLVLLGLWFLVSHWCWCGSLGRCCDRSTALKKSTFTRNSKTAAQTKRLILNYWFIFSITVYKHIFYAYIYLCLLMRIRVHRHPVNKTSTSLLLKSWSRSSTRQEQESWNWSKGLNEWFFSWRKLVAIRNQQTEKGRLFPDTGMNFCSLWKQVSSRAFPRSSQVPAFPSLLLCQLMVHPHSMNCPKLKIKVT